MKFRGVQRVAVFVVLAVAGGLAFLWSWPERVVDEPPAEQPASVTIQLAPVVTAEERPPAPPPHPMAVSFGSGLMPPEQEPAVLLEILQAYRRVAGSFPTAEDNPQLMKTLRGEGPGGLMLFPSDHARYDADGALLDAWGTPFFFHHIGSQRIEIRSAGPDRTLYSADDIVAGP